MHRSYEEWINQRIYRHQNEIARLTIALSVIQEANSEEESKINGPKPKRLAKPGIVGRRGGRKYSEEVLASVTRLGRAGSADIINDLGFTSKVDKQSVYNALSYLVNRGVLTRDEHRVFWLTIPAQGEQAA